MFCVVMFCMGKSVPTIFVEGQKFVFVGLLSIYCLYWNYWPLLKV